MKALSYIGISLLLGSALGLSVACGSDGNDEGTGANSGVGAGTSSSSSNGGAASGGAGGGAGQGTVLINEIMFDPTEVSDEAGEWIELYNPSDAAVDLEGWTLRDDGANNHVIGPLSIDPGQFLVLARNGNSAQNGGAPADYSYADFALNNSGGDAVLLEDAEGALVDSVEYGDAAPWPMATSGVSFELTATNLDNSDAANWQLAVLPYGDGDLGTPGRPNGGMVGSGYTIDNNAVSWHQPDLSTSVHFAPNDDLEAHVLAQLATAQTSIRLAFFNVRLPAVRDLLIQKDGAGVDVKVVLDKKQQDLSYNTMGVELTNAGVDVTLVENTSATDATMHNKFTIVDGHLLIAGSANYSYTALNISDEDLITIDDTGLAARYQLEFDELVASGDVDSAPYASNTPLMAFMGPEDNIWSRVRDAIDGAQSSVTVAMFQLNTSSLVDALLAAHQRNVNVVIVLDEVQAANGTADETLAGAGVPVVLADNTGSNAAEMHSKFVVIDHDLVLMGSYNWTNLGSFFNDENIIVMDDSDLAARAEGKFAELIDSYSLSTPSALGLTTGQQSLSLDVTNVTMDPGVELTIQSLNGGPWASPTVLTGTSLTASVAAGTRVTYRYAIRDANSTLVQETGTHSFTVPYAPGPYSVRDAFTP